MWGFQVLAEMNIGMLTLSEKSRCAGIKQRGAQGSAIHFVDDETAWDKETNVMIRHSKFYSVYSRAIKYQEAILLS